MFIYTGLLKATDNEAQLAGVMGHEMSHVILRHGTHEATKANAISLFAGGLGALIGGESTGGKLAKAGLGLAGNSFILKFSRDAETEADAMGSHLMADAGYDPVQMAKFFEKLNASGGQQLQILSDHPNPGNREAAIKAEMQTLPQKRYNTDTGQFARVRKEVAALPPPAKKATANAPAPGATVPANNPDWQTYQGAGFAIDLPKAWQVFGEARATDVTLAPKDGIVSKDGRTQIGFGAVIGLFRPQQGRTSLEAANADLIRGLRESNSRMTPGSSQPATVVGLHALTTTMRSDSVFGGEEVDTVTAVERQGALWYIVFIAPAKDQPRVEATFRQMLNSLRFN